MTNIQTTTITTSRNEEYTALTDGAALQVRPDAGVLLLTGADRVDFLQRMTTNNIATLHANRAVVTVLTSPTARILFVFTVLHRPDDLLLLPARNQTEELERQLHSQIFFMDQVQVQNISTDYQRLRVLGKRAAETLATLGFDPTNMQDSSWQEHENQILLKQEQYDLPGYELLIPPAQEAAVLNLLQSAGALLLQDDDAYTTRRIELGRPLTGHELTTDYSPLETGLAWTCSENKGCYTGQEIIARQITYDKVTKRLVGLRSSEQLTPGDTVTGEDGRTAGEVTSVAYSPTLGAPVALAILRRAYTEPGTQVTVGEKTAYIIELPIATES